MKFTSIGSANLFRGILLLNSAASPESSSPHACIAIAVFTTVGQIQF